MIFNTFSQKCIFKLQISTKQSLNEIVRQIRAETKLLAGKGTLECVEVVRFCLKKGLRHTVDML